MTEVTVSADVYWVDPQVADLFPHSWFGDPTFIVATDDTVGAVAALTEAVARFLVMDDTGRELTATQVASGRWWTPGGASGPYLTDQGIVVSLDCDGEFSRARGQAMIEVLVAELWSRQVSAHVARPPEGLDWANAPRWLPSAR
jgi:hypothetical protein